MKYMVISYILLFIFILPLTIALEFTFDAPSEIELKESVTVSVDAFTSEVYDVKIYVKDSADKVLSEIYDDAWKSAFFYIKESFPAEKKYNIRITKASGNFELCVKLRKSGKTSASEKCKKIEVMSSSDRSSDKSDDLEPEIEDYSSSSSESEKESNAQNTDNNEESKNKENKGEVVFIDNNKLKKSKEIEILTQPLQEPLLEELESPQKIILNNNSEDSSKILEETFTTKNEKIKTYIIYAFSIFSVIIIILLALRKL